MRTVKVAPLGDMVNGASRFCNSQLILCGAFASSFSTLEQRFADTKKDGP
jgi:hypothetical protein